MKPHFRQPTSLLLTSLRSSWRLPSRPANRTFKPATQSGLTAARTYGWAPPSHVFSPNNHYTFLQRLLFRPSVRRTLWSSIALGYLAAFTLGFYVRGRETWAPTSILGLKVLKDRTPLQRLQYRLGPPQDKVVGGDIQEWITEPAPPFEAEDSGGRNNDDPLAYDDSQRSFSTTRGGAPLAPSSPGFFSAQRAATAARPIRSFHVVYTTGQGWDIDLNEGESLRFDFLAPQPAEATPFVERVGDRCDMRSIERVTVVYEDGGAEGFDAKEACQVHVSVVNSRAGLGVGLGSEAEGGEGWVTVVDARPPEEGDIGQENGGWEDRGAAGGGGQQQTTSSELGVAISKEKSPAAAVGEKTMPEATTMPEDRDRDGDQRRNRDSHEKTKEETR